MRNLYFILATTLVLSNATSYSQELRLNINNIKDTNKILDLIVKADSTINTDSAMTLYAAAYRFSVQYNYLYGKAAAIEHQAKRYSKVGSYNKALELFLHLKGLLDAQPLSRLSKGITLTHIGNMYQTTGRYDSAIEYYYMALSAEQGNPGGKALIYIYNSLGSALVMAGKYEKAIYYLHKSVQLSKESKLYSSGAGALSNIGNAYGLMGRADSAIFYYKAGLLLAKQMSLPDLSHNIFLNLGKLYLDQYLPDQALKQFREAEQYAYAVTPYYNNGLMAMTGIAYSQLKNYTKAEEYLVKALQQADTLKAERNIYEIHHALADVYAATGRYQKAFGHMQQYATLNNKVMSAEKLNQAQQLEVQYRTAQKDKELAENRLFINQQNTKIREQKFWMYGIVTGVLLLGISFYSLYRSYKYRKDKQFQLLHQQQEIEQLKAMMKGEEQERGRLARELHDGIGGMLASIRMNLSVVQNELLPVLHASKLDNLMAQVQETAAEVRRTAHNLMPDVLTKHSITDALVIYCNTLSKDQEPAIEIRFKGNWQLFDKATELMIYRMVQEMLQNIIKHAQARHAILQLIEEDGKIMIFAEDDGRGFEVNGSHSGYGLQNLRHRVHALNGEISIMSDPGKGTAIYIEFNKGGL